MREILFRGKRVDNGEWGTSYNPNATMVCGVERVAFDPATVGQYTGLQDKNGKQIFEGDILRYGLRVDYECYLESLECPDAYDGEVYDQDIETGAVVWCADYDYPAFDLQDHQFECNGLSQLKSDDYECEIIGNIHDNPELLGGAER